MGKLDVIHSCYTAVHTFLPGLLYDVYGTFGPSYLLAGSCQILGGILMFAVFMLQRRNESPSPVTAEMAIVTVNEADNKSLAKVKEADNSSLLYGSLPSLG